MAVEITTHIVSVVVGLVTWDKDNGGPTAVRYDSQSQNLETRVANNLYPVCSKAVDASATLTVSLSELNPADGPTVGDKDNVVVTLEQCDGTTVAKTFYNMVYRGLSGNQDRAATGTADLVWQFASSDGTKGPTEIP